MTGFDPAMPYEAAPTGKRDHRTDDSDVTSRPAYYEGSALARRLKRVGGTVTVKPQFRLTKVSFILRLILNTTTVTDGISSADLT